MSNTHSIDDVYRDVEVIREEVHNLSLTKQDRIKPAAYLTMFIFLFAQTVSAVWWASELTSGIRNLTEKVAELNVDRFSGKEGQQLKTLIDIEISNLADRVSEMKAEIKELEASVDRNINRIATIKSVQSECQKRLKMKQIDDGEGI